MPKGITKSELRQIFNYCPDTGFFTYKKKVSKKINVGQIAGTVQESDSGKKYVHIIINGYRYRAHHLAWIYMFGSIPPKMMLDHLNGDGTDNRISNLEQKTHQENHKNKRLFKNNKLGIPGVYWRKDKHVYSAQIKIDKVNYHLTNTNDFFEACCARKSAERKLGFHSNHGSIRPL